MVEEPLNQLFQFLRSTFRAVGEAHRTNPRRHTSKPARLAWFDGVRHRTVRARLIDISRAGAALVTSSVPPLSAAARVRLVGREPTPWIEAAILGAEPEPRGRYRIRLKFAEPCTTYFLRVAVLGPIAPDADDVVPCVTKNEAMDLTLQSSSPHP
jgi:hypothetical protein